jgi:hypothetical protein
MSKTACWAFNDDTDCANVFFGWPSRWDQCGSTTRHGYQLSKKALKLLLYYDYPFDYGEYHFLNKQRLFDFKIPFEPQVFKDGYYKLNKEEIKKLPTYAKMRMGHLFIKHPQWEQWYEECEGITGRFIRITGQRPPLLEDIKKINEVHYNAIKRIYEMNDKAMKVCPPKPVPGLQYATDEEIQDILDEWDEEDRIRKETSVEKWKKWNNQL